MSLDIEPLQLESSPYVKAVGKLTGHKDHVSAMAWSPDSQWLASCSTDGTLNLWSSLRANNSPRFVFPSQRLSGAALTSVGWSHDGRYLACGCTAGRVHIWKTGSFGQLFHADDSAKAAVRCLAWAGGQDSEDLRLAYGGDDGIVQFRNYRRWDRPDAETGVGHVHEILSIAWCREGKTVVTGTNEGTIGIWEVSEHDNQLRELLSWQGIRAHDDAVNALAWCPTTKVLASGGGDGRLHLWDLQDRLLKSQLLLDEQVLDLEFALQGQILIAQTRDHIRFFRAHPFREIHACDLPASLSPANSIAIDSSSRLAALDREDRSTINVWRVDLEAMLKWSELTRRSYSSVGVSLLGEPGSGRTNLAHALTGKSFVAQRTQHPFQVHRLALPKVESDNQLDAREIVFWDLPSRVDHALVQRIHAGDGSVAVVVLDPIPGSDIADHRNIIRWRHTLRRWSTTARRQTLAFVVVIAKCDTLKRAPAPDAAIAIAAALEIDDVILTSAKQEQLGISELKAAIIGAIEWKRAGSFPSVEVFDHLVRFVGGLRQQQRFLTSIRELFRLFQKELPFVAGYVPEEDDFRRSIRLLEVLGEAHLFEQSDEILLAPGYYHTYASAMIAAAEKDPTEMGRLCRDEAKLGRGESMHVEEQDRLSDRKQEIRLLGLTIDEVLARDLAQTVYTDNVEYLVFPISMTKVRDAADPRPTRRTQCKLIGEVNAAYSALIVRLLGMGPHYPDSQVWKHEATFTPAAGGCCGIAMNANDAGDEALLSLYFAEGTPDFEERKFVDIVRDHVQARTRLEGTLEPPAKARLEVALEPSADAGKPPGNVEVFFCWNSSIADSVTKQHVFMIESKLKARGIAAINVSSVKLGNTSQERQDQVTNSRVALILLAGPLSKNQKTDYVRLEQAGCRIIPVILPNAKQNFALPELLRSWDHVDFRGKFLDADLETLAEGITKAWQLGRTKQSSSSGHAFLSYFANDGHLVAPLRNELERAGHTIWWDKAFLRPGTPWESEIKAAIKSSYAFILCVSESSAYRAQSEVYSEIDEAIKVQTASHPNRIFIIPVRLSAACEVPAKRIDSRQTLRDLQRFDYFDRNKSCSELVSVLDTARLQSSGGPALLIAPSVLARADTPSAWQQR